MPAVYIHSQSMYEHGKLFPTEEQLHTRRKYVHKITGGISKENVWKISCDDTKT